MVTPPDAVQLDQARTATRNRWAWLPSLRIALGAVGFIMIAGAIVVGVMFLTRPSLEPPSLVYVEERWRDAVRRYGIEPVFPPEEDFAVGDLFVEVVDDTDPDQSAAKLQSSFRSRSVKVDHVDVREQLEKLYGMVPVFGDAAPPGAPMPGLFAAVRHALPIAALPDVNASSTNAASAGSSGGLTGSLFGMIGLAASSQTQEKTAFRSMVTYGLTSVLAERTLDEYCSNATTKDNCTEAVARRHIRSIVGPRADAQYIDPRNPLKSKYALTIRFFMVSRVYLTSGIITQTQLARALGGGGTLLLDPSASQSETTARPAPAAAGGDTAATSVGVQQRLDALEKQLADLRQGGAASYASSYDRGSRYGSDVCAAGGHRLPFRDLRSQSKPVVAVPCKPDAVLLHFFLLSWPRPPLLQERSPKNPTIRGIFSFSTPGRRRTSATPTLVCSQFSRGL
jgi:hypothetical protein